MALTMIILILLGITLDLPRLIAEKDKLYQAKVGIVNGKEADPGQFPYQVGIDVFYDDGSSIFCGGSLISPYYVLTAAHCAKSATSVRLIFGAHNIYENESTQLRVNSQAISPHSKFNGITRDNDIALIKVPQEILETEFIKMIEIDTGNDVFSGDKGVVAGWGQTNKEPVKSPTLQYITSEIISNEQCGAINTAYKWIINPTKLCLSGKLEGKNISTCRGDSGGPLVVNGVQVGIVSFGPTDCSGGYPSVFTRLNKFSDWIKLNTNSTV